MINAIGTNAGASSPGKSRGGNGGGNGMGNGGGSIGGKGRPSLDPQVITGSGTRTGGRGEPIAKPRGKPLEVVDSAPIGGNTGPVGRGSSRNNNPRAAVIAPVGGGGGGIGGGGRSNSSFQSNGINNPSFVNSNSQWNGGNNGNNWGGHSNGWNNSGNCGNGWGHGWNSGGSCWSGCNPSGWYGNWVGYWPYTSGLALGYYGSGWTFGLSVGFGSGWYGGCGSWPYYGSYGDCWYPSSWSLSYGSCWNDCGWYPYRYAYGCYRPRYVYYQPVIYGAYTAPAYDWLAEPAVTTTYYAPSDIANTDQVYEFADTSAQTAPAEASDFAPPPFAGAPVILDSTPTEHRSGWQLLAEGDAREARRSFDRSLNMQSTDGLARVGYALAAGQLGRYEEAVSGMRQALRQDPQSIDEIPQNSGIDAQIGQLQDHFEAELKSNQANVDDLFMVAALRHLNGQNGLAYYAADRAIELGDHDQSVVNLKALIRKAIDSADQSAPSPATAPTVNAPSIAAPAAAPAAATAPASPEPLF